MIDMWTQFSIGDHANEHGICLRSILFCENVEEGLVESENLLFDTIIVLLISNFDSFANAIQRKIGTYVWKCCQLALAREWEAQPSVEIGISSQLQLQLRPSCPPRRPNRMYPIELAVNKVRRVLIPFTILLIQYACTWLRWFLVQSFKRNFSSKRCDWSLTISYIAQIVTFRPISTDSY